MNKAQAMALLSFHLGNSDNHYARLFIANRLYVDFGQESLEIILAASRVEQVDFVKTDYLYYLTQAESQDIRQQARGIEWSTRNYYPLTHSFLMGVLTPGRHKDHLENIPHILLKQLGVAEPSEK